MSTFSWIVAIIYAFAIGFAVGGRVLLWDMNRQRR